MCSAAAGKGWAAPPPAMAFAYPGVHGGVRISTHTFTFMVSRSSALPRLPLHPLQWLERSQRPCVQLDKLFVSSTCHRSRPPDPSPCPSPATPSAPVGAGGVGAGGRRRVCVWQHLPVPAVEQCLCAPAQPAVHAGARCLHEGVGGEVGGVSRGAGRQAGAKTGRGRGQG